MLFRAVCQFDLRKRVMREGRQVSSQLLRVQSTPLSQTEGVIVHDQLLELQLETGEPALDLPAHAPPHSRQAGGIDAEEARSEEHTSELQYQMRNSYTVFCLKKKH